MKNRVTISQRFRTYDIAFTVHSLQIDRLRDFIDKLQQHTKGQLEGERTLILYHHIHSNSFQYNLNELAKELLVRFVTKFQNRRLVAQIPRAYPINSHNGLTQTKERLSGVLYLANEIREKI